MQMVDAKPHWLWGGGQIQIHPAKDKWNVALLRHKAKVSTLTFFEQESKLVITSSLNIADAEMQSALLMRLPASGAKGLAGQNRNRRHAYTPQQ